MYFNAHIIHIHKSRVDALLADPLARATNVASAAGAMVTLATRAVASARADGMTKGGGVYRLDKECVSPPFPPFARSSRSGAGSRRQDWFKFTVPGPPRPQLIG